MDNTHYAGVSHECRVAWFMAEMGHEVHLVTERPPKWDSEPPKTLTQTIEPRLNEPLQEGLRSHASRTASVWPAADVGFASSVSGAPFLAAWKQRTGRPVVAQVLDVPLWRLRLGEHGPWWRAWHPWYAGLLGMDRLVVNTEQTQKDLVELAHLYATAPYNSARVRVVYYGVDTDAADAAPSKPQVRGAGNPRGWVGCVGRLVPYRGVDQVIEAISLIPEEERPGLVVVGGGEDAQRLMHLALLADVTAAFVGGCSDADKWAILKEWCTIGAAMQFNPNIPQQAGTEFLYAGKPCVVSDLPIHRERTLGHATYVNPFDTNALSTEIQALLGMVLRPVDDSVGKMLAEDAAAARKFVAEERSFRSHARGVLQVLEEVCA